MRRPMELVDEYARMWRKLWCSTLQMLYQNLLGKVSDMRAGPRRALFPRISWTRVNRRRQLNNLLEIRHLNNSTILKLQ